MIGFAVALWLASHQPMIEDEPVLRKECNEDAGLTIQQMLDREEDATYEAFVRRQAEEWMQTIEERR